MTPCYYILDCIYAADGRLQVVDVHGGVGGGLAGLAAAYGGKSAARGRLRPFLQRLGEVAQGRRVLFINDSYPDTPAFPDDFFNLVQQFAAFCPVTDWIPDLQTQRRAANGEQRTAEVEEYWSLLDAIAGRLRVKVAYCSGARVDDHPTEGMPVPMLLLSGYRERARHRSTSVIMPPEEVGAAVYSGASYRFPEDFRRQSWFPVINPPLVDRFFETRWLLPFLLEGTPAAHLLPRSIPVGMGMRTAKEVMEFTSVTQVPGGFPLAVLKPGHLALAPGVRFMDRTALRALAARQPERRLPANLGEELLCPRVSHSYEEVTGYRGRVMDQLLRTPGAEIIDHGDGTFHYSAPYPFLQTTVAILQEYVDARPVRARRTGRFHRGFIRAVMFDRTLVSAIHHLDPEPDEGTFRPWPRPDAPLLLEGLAPDDEAALQADLAPFLDELERQFASCVRTEADLAALRRRWLEAQLKCPP